MQPDPPPFPAMLLCRGQGTIFFANSPAIEQTGRVTGAALASFGTLEGLLARLYPAAQEGTANSLARALRLARRRGSLRLRVSLPEHSQGPRNWDVCIAPRPDQTEETYQLNFQPHGTEASMPDPRVHILHASAGHARRILDKAMEAAEAAPGTTDDKIELMLGLIRRARGLLATLEEMPEEALNPATPPLRVEG